MGFNTVPAGVDDSYALDVPCRPSWPAAGLAGSTASWSAIRWSQVGGSGNVAKATPNLGLTDPDGTYDGNPFVASVTVAGSGSDNSPAGSLQGISPTLTYYDGTGTSGTSLGSTPPSAPGTYTVVAAFPLPQTMSKPRYRRRSCS